MLKRKMLQSLLEWKRTHRNECLLINGARQVGKSFIVNAFAEENYESFIAIDFVRNPEYKDIFSGSLKADEIYSRISLLIPGVQLIQGNTLIFLDEIQECPEARSALKYLAQDGRFDVIGSGSLLGIRFRNLAEAPSLPVGYERQITLHPLDFEEFLWARGYKDNSIGKLREYFINKEPVPWAIHEKIMRHLREFLAIGGMPAVVEKFVQDMNYSDAHNEQLKIHELYLDDIAKYASTTERLKARSCYLSLPRQLAKENTKFRYATVEEKGSARKFEGSVDWLAGANMVLQCTRVASPQFPLALYEDPQKFRLYANDTGLLMAMLGFKMKAAVVENTLKGPAKGGLYENLVATMLACKEIPLHYWMSKSTKHEIEFIIDGDSSVIPIEVKASRGSTVSLDAILEREDVSYGYKLIDGNIGQVEKEITLPLYMAMFL